MVSVGRTIGGSVSNGGRIVRGSSSKRGRTAGGGFSDLVALGQLVIVINSTLRA